jgi:transposase
LFLLSERQMARISPLSPLSHDVPRVDDRRVISGIIYVIKHGLQWKDCSESVWPAQDPLQSFCPLEPAFPRLYESAPAFDGSIRIISAFRAGRFLRLSIFKPTVHFSPITDTALSKLKIFVPVGGPRADGPLERAAEDSRSF